jgi:phosphoribosyl 1,2-cyclic phosphodiesterase
VGYRITVNEGDAIATVGYATDLGVITPAVEEGLLGCEAVVLESNHDEEMLMTGPYPYYLKKRIASRRGHLSNPESALLAAHLCATGTRGLMLAHLSAENNTPEIAYDECFGAIADTGIHICVADPYQPTELTI